MKTFRAESIPGVNRREVVEFCHAAAGGGKVAGRMSACWIKLRNVENISEDRP